MSKIAEELLVKFGSHYAEIADYIETNYVKKKDIKELESVYMLIQNALWENPQNLIADYNLIIKEISRLKEIERRYHNTIESLGSELIEEVTKPLKEQPKLPEKLSSVELAMGNYCGEKLNELIDYLGAIK